MRSSPTTLAAASAFAVAVAACGSSGGTNSSTSTTCTDPNAGITFPGGCAEAAVSTTGITLSQHLGSFTVGQTVSFTVPPNSVSVTIVEQAVAGAPLTITLFQPGCSNGFVQSNVAVPLRITNDVGALVYDDTKQPSSTPEAVSAFFASDAPFTGTLTIPNTTAALQAGPLPAGTWTLVVNDFANECAFLGSSCQGGATTGQYDVTVITKAAAGGVIPPSGALDVRLHFATTATADPARPLPDTTVALQADGDVVRLGSTIAKLFQSQGVTATVTPDLLDATVRTAFATGVDVDQAGPCAPLSQLFQTLPPTTAPSALNVFLVSALHGGATGGNITVGIDGTIPGPAGIPGTVSSGAAAGTNDLRGVTSPGACAGAIDFANCGDDRLAYIIAHEMGHFLGLYHTTEAEGTAFDPLHDTAQCSCSQCAPTAQRASCGTGANPPTVGVANCLAATGCAGGGDNLMFWLFNPSLSQGNLTAEQGQVIRANPLVQ